MPHRVWNPKPSSPIATLALALLVACSSDPTPSGGADAGGGGGGGGGGGPTGPFSVDVSSVFGPGDRLRDAYSGALHVVGDDGRVAFDSVAAPVLLEREAAPAAPFTWDNATVYFVITDRFFNGDPSNDRSYGRAPDGREEIATFHGGDLAGLTQRLDHLAELGVNVVWVTALYEQIHGWVGGGAGDFKHYPYHGYYALDYTNVDANFGTEAEVEAFVSAAHDRGIRVVMDVVMNHPGYATMEDLSRFVPSVLRPGWDTWEPGPGETWHAYHDRFIDYMNPDWQGWWGGKWVRAGLPGDYSRPGQGDILGSLSSLPDFRTEDFRPAGLPPFFARMPTTKAVEIPGATVRQYLVTWLSDWVRRYGIDGFRCDTAKHVELEAWTELKAAGRDALREWKAAHPDDKLDDLDFWMTGEVFPHGVERDGYFDGGFDSLINFDFQGKAPMLIEDRAALEAEYATYAERINSDPSFNVLSYASSHDTSLMFETLGREVARQRRLGTALLMLPGGVQIFYGDETGRPEGAKGTDRHMGTRSDMNWGAWDAGLLEHWQKLGRFRRAHPAIGAGQHVRLGDAPYAFSRKATVGGVEDAVVVILPSGV